jgi:hypothetical protein
MPPLSDAGVVVPPRVERILASLLRRDERRRAGDAARVAEALSHAAAKLDEPEVPADARPPVRSGARGADATVSLTPRLTPASRTRRGGRGRRLLQAAAAAAGVLEQGGALLVWAMLAPRPAGESTFQLVGDPEVIAGVTSAAIQWTTNQPAPTRVWLWPDGRSHEAKVFMPPTSGAEAPTRNHGLTVRGLTPGATLWFRVIFPDGRMTPAPFAIQPRTDLSGLTEGYSARYLDPDHVEISFDCLKNVTPGVQLVGRAEGPGRVVWAPGRGAGRRRFELAVGRRDDVYQPRLRFQELDDEEVDRTGGSFKNYKTERLLPAPSRLWQILREKLSGPEGARLAGLPGDILRARRLCHPGLAANRLPTRDHVARLDANRRERFLAEARRIVRSRLQEFWEVDIDLVVSSAGHWLKEPRIPALERQQSYEDLMRLSDLDAAAQLVAGTPLFDVEAASSAAVAVERETPLPVSGFRPIQRLAGPELSAILDKTHLSVFNCLDFHDTESVVSINIDDHLTLQHRLVLPDPADPRHSRGMWLALGRVPDGVPLSGRLVIAAALGNMVPEKRLWIRLGPRRKVLMRHTLFTCKGILSQAANPTRAEVEAKATTVQVAVPAGFFEESDRDLAVRLDVFSTTDPGGGAYGPDCIPHGAWITDLVIAPGPT